MELVTEWFGWMEKKLGDAPGEPGYLLADVLYGKRRGRTGARFMSQDCYGVSLAKIETDCLASPEMNASSSDSSKRCELPVKKSAGPAILVASVSPDSGSAGQPPRLAKIVAARGKVPFPSTAKSSAA
jgi:hypothetical protein